MEADRVARAARIFTRARDCVIRQGFGDEVQWACETTVATLTERDFLAEFAWCVLNAGMREAVVRRKWPNVSAAFFDFVSSEAICAMAESCVRIARRSFNHPGKLEAIVAGARRVRADGGFERFKRHLLEAPIDRLRSLPFIGPVTVYHLARNLGFDCAKPDRHLVRLSEALGFPDVSTMCSAIASRTSERIGVVDVVLWRHLANGCQCTDEARLAA